MAHDDPLMTGMFWAGLLMASVPMGLAVGVGLYILKQHLQARRDEPPEPQHQG